MLLPLKMFPPPIWTPIHQLIFMQFPYRIAEKLIYFMLLNGKLKKHVEKSWQAHDQGHYMAGNISCATAFFISNRR